MAIVIGGSKKMMDLLMIAILVGSFGLVKLFMNICEKIIEE